MSKNIFRVATVNVVIELFIVFISFILVSCSTFQKVSSDQKNLHYLKWQDRKKQLNAVENWYIQGSLGLTYNNKTEIVTFEWRKAHKNYLVNIYGPLRLGSVQISGDDRQAILLQSSGRKSLASTPEELMQQQLGWNLPLYNLNYWIRALTAPASQLVPEPSTVKFDADNHLINFTQEDWLITYSDFRVFSGIDLPTKIHLRSPQLHAKIIIKNWNIISPRNF